MAIKGNPALIGLSFLNEIEKYDGINFEVMMWSQSQNSTHDATDANVYEDVTFTDNASKYYSGIEDYNSNLKVPSFTIEKADLALVFATFNWNLPSDTVATGKNNAYMTLIKHPESGSGSDVINFRFHVEGISDNTLKADSMVVPFTNLDNHTIQFKKQKGMQLNNLVIGVIVMNFPMN